MNMQDPQFDAALRAHWQTAARHLPGPLKMQLSPALAAQKKRPASARWLPLGASFASLALLALLLLRPALAPEPAPPATLAAPTEAGVLVEDEDDSLLGRNPDFYLWLGSDEAQTLALQ